MESISILSHDFEKQNNITIRRGNQLYDIYRCRCCGLTGKRMGLAGEISVSGNKVSCRRYKSFVQKNKEAEKVKITHPYPCDQFGFELYKVYDRIPCPENMRDKYADDVWVFSENRKEPVRLLEGEFRLLE